MQKVFFFCFIYTIKIFKKFIRIRTDNGKKVKKKDLFLKQKKKKKIEKKSPSSELTKIGKTALVYFGI